MTIAIAMIAIDDDHLEPESAVTELQVPAFEMKQLSIVGKDYLTEDHVISSSRAEDGMMHSGKLSAFWGGMWGLLLGAAFLWVPGIGPLFWVAARSWDGSLPASKKADWPSNVLELLIIPARASRELLFGNNVLTFFVSLLVLRRFLCRLFGQALNPLLRRGIRDGLVFQFRLFRIHKLFGHGHPSCRQSGCNRHAKAGSEGAPSDQDESRAFIPRKFELLKYVSANGREFVAKRREIVR
jgi:hypothetical protein